MDWKSERRPLALVSAVFLACYFMPAGQARFDNAVLEGLALARGYAREHVLLCMVPALFIAGGIAAFVRQTSVMRYLGPDANPWLAYGVASVAGTVLAVCSCTVLPLFAGIWRMGAGLGPATAFLYSGPAINVLAVVLTARVLGPGLGLARAVAAVGFSVGIGLAMRALFRKDRTQDAAAAAVPDSPPARPLWKTCLFFAALVGILVFANWARSGDVRAVFLCCPGGLSLYQVEGRVKGQDEAGVLIEDVAGVERLIPRDRLRSLEPAEPDAVRDAVHRLRWGLVAALLAALGFMAFRWFTREERAEWVASSWGLGKQMLPLLLAGVMVSGVLMGRPGREGLVPGRYIETAVGASPRAFLDAIGAEGAAAGFISVTWPLWTNLFASVLGALMYFATLTEVPIVQGLLGAGMGKGPALALLLAGPALSLPSMLVIGSVLGTRKTLAYVALVVLTAAAAGMAYGAFAV